MRRVQLCHATEAPTLNCRLNQKFTFIKLGSAAMANQAMHMNGIPFLGAVLKISRPSKYDRPPDTGKLMWQELMGQSLPNGAVLDADMEKMLHELLIGNLTPEMTEVVCATFWTRPCNKSA